MELITTVESCSTFNYFFYEITSFHKSFYAADRYCIDKSA